MINFIIKKTIRLIGLLFFVSLITFVLMEISPIDPVNAYLTSADVVSTDQKMMIESYFGLDKSPVTRYFEWIKNICKGNLGVSIIYRVPVAEIISQKFTNSLILMLSTFILSGIIGLSLGILMGQNEKCNKILRPICLTITAMPTFFVGIIFLIVFSVKLDIFPVALSVPIGVLSENVNFFDNLKHLILPVITLSFTSFASIALHTREKVIEIMNEDYILLAKTRGFTKKQIISRHLLRNILLPFITLQFASLSEIFGGSILAETVFSYPGLGSVIVTAGLSGDVTLLLGVTMFSCIFVFFGNFIANILYAIIDPKIRLESSL